LVLEALVSFRFVSFRFSGMGFGDGFWCLLIQGYGIDCNE
jgi:hypothetical protein